jgi:hypothetical protein
MGILCSIPRVRRKRLREALEVRAPWEVKSKHFGSFSLTLMRARLTWPRQTELGGVKVWTTVKAPDHEGKATLD